ncbi:MAG: T9SS type A sorting domain-containing protein [Ignavibacteria bacterium]|nr:T9SS type A sorting domain-containing protein [Ignavibacteria bacterium]
MKNFILVLLLGIIISFSNKTYAQGVIYDDFSVKAMPGWVWGGVDMKYSHNEDNKENGYGEIFTKDIVKSNSYIGKITKISPVLMTAGNFLNVMLMGVSNDVTAKLQILYDLDNNKSYSKDKDLMFESIPVSMNFEGWKQIKLKLDQDNFAIITETEEDFSVTEEEALGIQLEFEAGKKYKESKFESGIALISEIVNKENLVSEKDDQKDEESYFDAKNFPNPFNPITTITYTLRESTFVNLTVYDRLGREVKNLVTENQSAGTHSVEFDGSSLPSGIYFYRIKTNENTEVKKMILAK